MPAEPRRGRGGRPRHARDTVRAATIGVRVTTAEYDKLRDKAKNLGLMPAQWLRQARLSRRLPPSSVPAINREQYAELARLCGNLNQLAEEYAKDTAEKAWAAPEAQQRRQEQELNRQLQRRRVGLVWGGEARKAS